MLKPSFWWVIGMLLLTHFILFTFAVREDWARHLLARERAATYQLMGPDNAKFAEERASHLFTKWFVDTGIQATTFDMFVPDISKADPAMKPIDNAGVFPWAEGRVRAFWTIIFLIINRISIALLWLPFVLVILTPFVIDAFVTRKVKATNFGLTSPHMQGIATRAAPLLVAVYLLAIFVPMYLSPYWVPTLLVTTSALCWVIIAHFVKRG